MLFFEIFEYWQACWRWMRLVPLRGRRREVRVFSEDRKDWDPLEY